MRRRGADPGFSLLEVVVAMAILGIGLVIIIELFGGGLRLGRTSQEYTKASAYARVKMEEISLADALEEGVDEGEFDKDFRWQTEVKKVDLLPPVETDYRPPVDFYRVKLEVLWKSGFRDRSAQFETYRTLKVKEGEEKR
jgi:general secretion pathway protein I